HYNIEVKAVYFTIVINKFASYPGAHHTPSCSFSLLTMAIHPESHIIRSKHCRLLAVVPALAVQATILVFLPFLANSSVSIPRPMRTSPLSGHQYIQESLKSSPHRIQEVLRMKLEVFSSCV